MSVMVILVAFSILVAAGFLFAFLWAVKSGQYDDRHTPALRMLFDDRPAAPQKAKQKTMKTDIKSKTEEQQDSCGSADSGMEVMREEGNRYGS